MRPSIMILSGFSLALIDTSAVASERCQAQYRWSVTQVCERGLRNSGNRARYTECLQQTERTLAMDIRTHESLRMKLPDRRPPQ